MLLRGKYDEEKHNKAKKGRQGGGGEVRVFVVSEEWPGFPERSEMVLQWYCLIAKNASVGGTEWKGQGDRRGILKSKQGPDDVGS